MMFNFSSFSKSYDNERLPKKRIELVINWLEKKKMSPYFFLNDKSHFLGAKKKYFFKTQSLDFNNLFLKSEFLPFTKISKYFENNLFYDNKNLKISKKGYVVGLKLKSNFIGAFYLYNSKIKKEDLTSILQYFKSIIQSNFNEISIAEKLKKNNSDLRNKKLEMESFLDISELLSSSSETEILFQNLLEYLVFTMNASKGIILSKEPNSGIFELKGSLGIDESISKKIFRENKGVLSLLKKEKKS